MHSTPYRRVTAYLILLFWSISVAVHAQPEHTELGDVVLPTPTAAALGEYVDMPVGYFTGVPSIGVPIHTLTEGPLSLPVSLSYHAGGVRVNSPASWTGMNWSLQAGGMVSRTTRGLMDEVFNGYYYSGKTLVGYDSNEAESVRNGLLDTEPDVFSFNFLGFTGKFYFDGFQNEIIQLPQTDIRIEVVLTEGKIYGFKFTDTAGNRYYFGVASKFDLRNPAAESTDMEVTDASINPLDLYTTWYLIKVESADGLYDIDLEYDDEKYSYLSPASTSKSNLGYYNVVLDCSGSSREVGFKYGSGQGFPVHQNVVDGKRLSRIRTQTTEIDFLPGALREDLIPYGNDSTAYPRQLATIAIKEGGAATDFSDPAYCTDFTLRYDYTRGKRADYLGSGTLAAGLDAQQTYRKRLRLRSVQQTSCDGQITIPPHAFDYDESEGDTQEFPNFPSILDKAVDHWGYYNGANSNNFKDLQAPRTLVRVVNSENNAVLLNSCFGDARRNTELNGPALLGSLTRHTFPTGGYTDYTMESNSVANLQDAEFTFNTVRSARNCDSYSSGTADFEACCADTLIPVYYTFNTLEEITSAEFYLAFSEINSLDPDNLNVAVCGGPSTTASTAIQIWDDLADTVMTRNINISTDVAPSTFVPFRDGPLTALTDALVPGRRYRFQFRARYATAVFELRLRELTYPNAKNQPVGGLRVKKINAYDPVDKKSIIREFDYEDNNGNSSGLLSRQPTYAYTYFVSIATLRVFGYEIKSSPVVPLGDFDGGHIGYGKVTERTPGNGKSIFLMDNRQPSNATTRYIPVPPVDPNFLRGQRIGDLALNSNGDTIRKSRSHRTDTRTLAIKPDQTEPLIAYVQFNIPTLYFPPGAKICAGAPGDLLPSPRFYPLYRGRQYIDRTLNTLDGVTTEERFSYQSQAGYTYLTSSRITNSNGEVTRKDLKYPENFSDPVYADTITGLTGRNMLPVIASETWVSDTTGSNFVQVDGSKTNYAFFNNFPRARSFERYEATVDAAGNWSGSPESRGTIHAYQYGYPSAFQPVGWQDTLIFSYKPSGLITSKRYADFNWIYRYKNDDTRMVDRITDIDGQYVDYTYDDLMRLTKQSARLDSISTTFDYIFNGQDPNLPGNFVRTTQTFLPTPGSELTSLTTLDYRDGLGRAIQSVRQAYSDDATPKDVVTAIDYEPSTGRSIRAYEPKRSTGSNGATISFTTSDPHTATDYYSDPLGRSKSTTPPEWNHPTRMEYGRNTTALSLTDGSYYGPSVLATQTTIDPNNNETVTYTDKLGRTLLTRRYEAGTNQLLRETLTAYDLKNRVATIYPPDATPATPELLFRYRYDGGDNVVYKKVPDRAAETMVYDDRDLLIRVSNPSIPAPFTHIASDYDTYGRLLREGFVSTPGGTIDPANSLRETTYGTAGITLGLPVTERTRILNGDGLGGWLTDSLYYDHFGRVSTMRSNHLRDADAGAEVTAYRYDLADNVLAERYAHRFGGKDMATLTETEIDHSGRITANWHTLSEAGVAGPRQQVSATRYTHKDEVKALSLGGSQNSALQTVDYTYLENGFLTEINQPGNLGDDLFALKLGYRQPAAGSGGAAQFNGNIASAVARVAGGEQFTMGYTYDGLDQLKTSTYNGTEAVADYGTSYSYDARGNLRTLNRSGYDPDAGTYGSIDQLGYQYVDNSNRLQRITDATSGPAAKLGFNSLKSGSNYGYDAAGNITYDPSRDQTADYNFLNLPFTFERPDGGFINYTYDAGGRKLREYELDAAGDTSRSRYYLGPVQYEDEAPALVLHPNGRVVPSGCPPLLTVDLPQTTDADYKALVIEGSSQISNGAEVNFVAGEEIILQPGFEVATGSTFGARIDPCGGSGPGWRYQYFLSDHLGNNRVLFGDENGDERVDAGEVVEEYHYYAFGLEMVGDWNGGAGQRYRYNGKELNEELGLYEYGFRWYDPAIGRFTGVDPISDQFAHLSTYNYASNEPIANIDLHGLQGIRYDMAAFDPGLNAINATSAERQEYQRSMGVGFALGVVTTGAVLGAAEIIPASAISLEASGATVATNVVTDAAVQTVVNSATGKDIVGDFDLVGTATSALTNPIVASAIDGVVDVTLGNGIEVNSPEEAMINTAVGGSMGTVAGKGLNAIPGSASKVKTAATGVTGVMANGAKAIAVDMIPTPVMQQDNTRVAQPLPIIVNEQQ